MKKATPFYAGVFAMVLFVLYACSGNRLHGPADKLVQLLVLFPAVLLLSSSLAPNWRFLKKFLNRLTGLSESIFLLMVSAFVLVFTLAVAIGPLQGIPKGGDEAAYFFQSRIYAAGRDAAPVPDVDNPHDLFPFRHFIFDEGRWFVMYTPMHSLLMAPFTALKLSYVMGPVESVLSLLGAFLLFRTLAGGKTARTATVVMALSPFFLFMGSSHMAHNTTLMFVTWSLYALVTGVKKGNALLCMVSGFLLGIALNTKPYPILPWSLTITIILFIKLRWKALKILFLLAAGALFPVVFFLLTNYHYTGDPLSPAYNLARRGQLIGFGPDKAWFPEYGDHAHTPARGLMNILKQAGAGSTILLGWPFLSLFPALAVVLDREVLRRVWMAAIPILMIAPFMFLHYSASIDYGPRHYYTALPAFALLTATGYQVLVRKYGAKALFVITGCYVVFTFAIYLPDGIDLRSGPWQAIDLIPVQTAEGRVEAPAVVFMEASEHGYPNIMSGIEATDPFLRGDVVFCAHQTPQEDMENLNGVFRGRKAYLFYMKNGEGFVEPWTFELASELLPERELRPEWLQKDSDAAKNPR